MPNLRTKLIFTKRTSVVGGVYSLCFACLSSIAILFIRVTTLPDGTPSYPVFPTSRILWSFAILSACVFALNHFAFKYIKIETVDLVANLGSIVSIFAVLSIAHTYQQESYSRFFTEYENIADTIRATAHEYKRSHCDSHQPDLCHHIDDLDSMLFVFCILSSDWTSDDIRYWSHKGVEEPFLSPAMAQHGDIREVQIIDRNLRQLEKMCTYIPDRPDTASSYFYFLQRPSYKIALGLFLFMFLVTKIAVSVRKAYLATNAS